MTELTSKVGQGVRGKRLLPGLALAVALAAMSAVVFAACGGGGKKSPTAVADTAVAGTSTPIGTPTAGANAGIKTPLAISPGNVLASADLAARGAGTAGRGDFNGQRLVIPSIGVDAPFSVKTVGSDGQMPNPNGPTDVAYYDFSQFPGLGGVPGKGGNVVLAGHVDYINYGPAVFWDLHKLGAGDTVEIALTDGTMATYKVEFNKELDASDGDFASIVQATADESITLITCTGDFANGHYNRRQIVWGRRV